MYGNVSWKSLGKKHDVEVVRERFALERHYRQVPGAECVIAFPVAIGARDKLTIKPPVFVAGILDDFPGQPVLWLAAWAEHRQAERDFVVLRRRQCRGSWVEVAYEYVCIQVNRLLIPRFQFPEKSLKQSQV